MALRLTVLLVFQASVLCTLIDGVPILTHHTFVYKFVQPYIVIQSELPAIDQNPDVLSLERLSASLGVELFITALSNYDSGWKPLRQPC